MVSSDYLKNAAEALGGLFNAINYYITNKTRCETRPSEGNLLVSISVYMNQSHVQNQSIALRS